MVAQIIAHSNPTNGALLTSADGSEFDIDLKRAIVIPKDAKSCSIEVVQAHVPWTVVNISAAKGNNQLRLEHKVSGVKTITLSDGLYSTPLLAAAVNRLFVNEGLADGSITLTGDYATQKVNIALTVDLRLTFIPTSMYLILGAVINSAYPSAATFTTTALTHFEMPSQAEFDQLTSFLIKSNICRYGIRYSGFSNIIANVMVNRAPSSILTYEPNRPLRIDTPELIGQRLDQVHFQITDQDNKRVDFGGSFWSVLLNLSWRA